MIARPLLELLEAVKERVVIDVLRPPTLEMLDAQLRAAVDEGFPYSVIHFDGHGTFIAEDGDRERGYLLFEDAHGGQDAVSVDTFAPVVRQARVPLVVLNSCRSGMQGDRRTVDAIATRLSDDGVTSVVSMAYSVYVDTAAEFIAAFYRSLFDGKSASEAVSAGRRRLHRHPLRPSPKGRLPLQDWIVPVHYARGSLAFPALAGSSKAKLPTLDAMLDARRVNRSANGSASGNAADAALLAVGRFVGRDEEIFSLERVLRTQHVVVVHGFGGTGKTELAKGFARWWQQSGALGNPDWVFFHSFVPGTAEFGLDRVLSEIGSALYDDFMAKTTGPEERRELVLGLLKQHRMLLIWDNFESVFSMPDPGRATPPMPPTERALMRDFLTELTAGAQSGVIITSRNEEEWLGSGPEPIRRLRLGGLPRDEAVELADALLEPYPGSKAWRAHPDFETLLDWVDGHPLTLRLLLPQLEHKHPSTLLAEIRGIGQLPEGFSGPDRLHSLSVSIKYSLDHLDKALHWRLPALSLFEGVVDRDVLALLSKATGVPERFAEISSEAWTATLRQLTAIGLLTPIDAGMYRLHPALPAYLAADWQAASGTGYSAERARAEESLLSAYTMFAEWLDIQLRTGDAPLASFLVSWQWRTMGTMVSAALRLSRFDDAQSLLTPMLWYFERRGLVEEMRNWLKRCMREVKEAAVEASDTENPAASLWYFAMSALGGIELDQDMHAARAIYEKLCLDLERLTPTAKQKGYLGTAYHQLGITLNALGLLDEAQSRLEKSLEIKREIGDDSQVSGTIYTLSVIALKRGDERAALKWCNQALEVSTRLGDQEGIAKSNYQLGRIAQYRGELAEAEEYYRSCFEIEITLDDRSGACGTIYQMGRIALIAGNAREAERRYRESLKIAESIRFLPVIGMNYDALGDLARLHDLDAAEAWYRKSLAIWQSMHDERRVAMTYRQLAEVAEALGRLDEAAELHRLGRAAAATAGATEEAKG